MRRCKGTKWRWRARPPAPRVAPTTADRERVWTLRTELRGWPFATRQNSTNLQVPFRVLSHRMLHRLITIGQGIKISVCKPQGSRVLQERRNRPVWQHTRCSCRTLGCFIAANTSSPASSLLRWTKRTGCVSDNEHEQRDGQGHQGAEDISRRTVQQSPRVQVPEGKPAN